MNFAWCSFSLSRNLPILFILPVMSGLTLGTTCRAAARSPDLAWAGQDAWNVHKPTAALRQVHAIVREGRAVWNAHAHRAQGRSPRDAGGACGFVTPCCISVPPRAVTFSGRATQRARGALGCRERGGEGDSPCGRRGSTPLPSSQHGRRKHTWQLLLAWRGAVPERASVSPLTSS